MSDRAFGLKVMLLRSSWKLLSCVRPSLQAQSDLRGMQRSTAGPRYRLELDADHNTPYKACDQDLAPFSSVLLFFPVFPGFFLASFSSSPAAWWVYASRMSRFREHELLQRWEEIDGGPRGLLLVVRRTEQVESTWILAASKLLFRNTKGVAPVRDA